MSDRYWLQSSSLSVSSDRGRSEYKIRIDVEFLSRGFISQPSLYIKGISYISKQDAQIA